MGMTKGITTPKGFRAAGGACGIKPSGKDDLALIVADKPCVAAGVFTTNRLPSPSVVIAKRHVRSGIAQAIVCNSGISNAATGQQGQRDALDMCRLVARHVPCLSSSWHKRVLPCSTGVIGQMLPMDKIRSGIEQLATRLRRGAKPNDAAARAIMTTDLVPKAGHREGPLRSASDTKVQLAGIAKGSGMIAPNMATMLVFITTDAVIAAPMLRAALKRAVADSFNCISVDQHTSPSDSVLILASGLAEHRIIDAPGPRLDRFTAVLTQLCQDLAYQIVKDGEGAVRVFRVCVVGAKSRRDADRVGRAIVDSPLVKTAVHGCDPNWGRITTAAGYSKAAIAPEKLSLYIGPPRARHWQQAMTATQANPSTTYLQDAKTHGVCVYQHDTPLTLDTRAAKRLGKIMTGDEIIFTLDLGLGSAYTEWLGCDLSREYITINADYTT